MNKTRQSYLIHDDLGNIWYVGHCYRDRMPSTPKGLTLRFIPISAKAKVQSHGGMKLFVSTSDESDFELAQDCGAIKLYKKKLITLSVTKRSFIVGKESINVTHNAPIPLRFWRDYHRPIHNSGHSTGKIPPSGAEFSSSIPGYYNLMIRHPRYTANPVVVAALVEE